VSGSTVVGRPAPKHCDRELTEFRLCEYCGQLLPAFVSRCRRRTCPAYASVWARDTRRKLRENLAAYRGLAAMLTLTAPGVDGGLEWDRELCSHDPRVSCSGPRGCRVDMVASARWNHFSRGLWRELNRVCKQRADRALRKLGAQDFKGHILAYQWEIQTRGVWHLHFVVGVGSPLEMAWSSEYVRAMRALAPDYKFGHLDTKPLHRPRPAESCAGYIAKYLTKRKVDGSYGASETVRTAGRALLTYVSRDLTQRTGVTMRTLRDARLLWAYREGLLPALAMTIEEVLFAAQLLDKPVAGARAP
jgi:hypothetical protein